MKRVIITGANGMIGGLILNACLQRTDVASVTCITRKGLGIEHPKLVEVLHNNFLDYTAINHHFAQKDICFYCIGVYTGQVPVSEFKQITVDFTIAFAQTLHRYSPHATFCFLSGQGADSTEKSNVLFAKQKGIAENALLRLQFPKTHLFRPGYIYPVTPRKEPNTFYAVMRVLYKPVSAIYPNIGVTSHQLAAKMIQVAFGVGSQAVYENAHIRQPL